MPHFINRHINTKLYYSYMINTIINFAIFSFAKTYIRIIETFATKYNFVLFLGFLYFEFYEKRYHKSKKNHK